MTRNEFFTALENGAKWNVGVSIARTNPLPLDANSVFQSVADLETYITTNPLAYPGQLVSVIGETELSAYHVTSVGENGTYSKLAASSASGDVAGDIATLQGQVATLISDLDALEAIVGATDADGLRKSIADNATAIETLNGGAETEGSVAKAVADAIGALDFSEDFDAKGSAAEVQGELDSYKETNDAAVKAADDKAVAAQADIDALEAKVGTVPEGKDVVTMIADAQAAATYDDTDVRGLITAEINRATAAEEANAAAIATEKARMDTFMAAGDGETLDTALDTLKEIQNYITTEAAAADQMVLDIASNRTAIEAEATRATGAEAGLEARIAAVEAYDHDADVQEAKDYADGIVATAKTEASADAQTKADAAKTAANTYTDEKIDALNIGDYAKSADVNAALENKTDRGTTLADYGITDAYTKGETETKIAEMISDINGGESAGEVLASLNAYKTSNDERVGTIETKLGTVEENAEVNIIEGIKVNGQEQMVLDKIVDITVPTKLDDLSGYTELAALVAGKVDAVEGKSLVDDDEIAKLVGLANIKSVSTELAINEDGELSVAAVDASKVTGLEALIESKHNVVATDSVLGVVMSNTAENGVVVANDGKMTVNSVNVNKLTQTDGEYLILNGGSSVN